MNSTIPTTHISQHPYHYGLNQEVQEAIRAMEAIKTIVPICSFCGNIRQPDGNWAKGDAEQLETPNINHSHGICPDCVKLQFPAQYQAIMEKTDGQ